MNILNLNPPLVGVTVFSPEFWVWDWIVPFKAIERVMAIKEDQDVSPVCGVGKLVPEFEPPPNTCAFFIDNDPSRESS